MDAPPIQYCRTEDGVNIAYWTRGDGPPLLFLVAPTASHLALEWKLPTFRAFYERLARDFTVVRYATRNAGESARDVSDLSIEGSTRDVEAVLNAIDAERAALVSVSFPVEVAIQFIRSFPNRVDALVALQPMSASKAGAMAEGSFQLGDRNWAAMVAGAADPERLNPREDVVDLMQRSIDPEDRLRFLLALRDTRGLPQDLSGIRVPTLLVQWPDNALGEPEIAQRLAAEIPHARMMTRSGEAGIQMDADVEGLTQAITGFVRESMPESFAHPSGAEPTPSTFRTLLFTDLESSTALTQSLGDAKAQEILHGHNDAVRAALAAHDGEEVKHTGDGIFAAFASVAAAVEAALQIQRELAGAEVRVRIGLNAGEPIAEDDDYFGSAVQLAARVCDRAEPGQILVPQVVRDLCRGKGFRFQDLEEATLKGFDEPVRLFVVNQQ